MERTNEEFRARRATDGIEAGREEDLAALELSKEASRSAGADFVARAQAIEAAGVHRRHEELLEIAVNEDGVPRELAEQAHELAHEEGLAPAYGLALVASGVGVEELVPPESGDSESIQQTTPEWVAMGDVGRDVIARERHLRSSFRRFRAHLERAGSAEAAAHAFLAEPDVGAIKY